MLVGGQSESNASGTDLLVAALDLAPAARRVLVDDRLAKADLAIAVRQHEIAIRPRPDVGAIELHRNDVRIGARPHDEVELEAPLGAVVDGIDAGVDVAIANARVAGHVRTPSGAVISDVVTAPARQSVGRLDGGGRVRAVQAHPDQGQMGIVGGPR